MAGLRGRKIDRVNPVFYKENTDMLLGTAKKSCEAIKADLQKVSG